MVSKENLHLYIFKNIKYKYFLFTLLVIASIFEFVGLSLIFPLINILFDLNTNTDNEFFNYIYNFFDQFNLNFNKSSLITVICFVILLKAIFLILYKFVCTFSTLEFMNNFRKTIFKKYFQSDYSILVDKKSMISNSISIQSDLAQSAMQLQFNLFENLLIIITTTTLLFFISSQILFISLIVSIFVILFFIFTFKISRKLARNLAENNRGLFKLIDQTTINIKYLKISMVYKKFYEQMLEVFENIKTNTIKFVIMNRGTKLLIEPILVINLSIIFIISFNILNISFEVILVVYVILARLVQKILSLITTLQEYFKDLVSVKYCKDLINNLDVNTNNTGFLQLNQFEELRLENITFGYNNTSNIIDNANLILKKNQITTLYGPSGSGKTTLSNIILGLIKPKNGKIILNNEILEKYDLNYFWQKIGYISQDSSIYNLTLKENLIMRNPLVSDHELIYYLNLFGLNKLGNDSFTDLNMQIDESISNLSNGEKQRICLIREMISEPDLLILDEFTSSLDSENIKNIIKNISLLKNKTTIFIITHQKEYFDISDNIYHLKNKKLNFAK